MGPKLIMSRKWELFRIPSPLTSVGNIIDRLAKNDNMYKGVEWLHFKIKVN